MLVLRPGNQPCGRGTALAVIEYRDLLRIIMEHPDYLSKWHYGVAADQYLIVRFAEAQPDDNPRERPQFRRLPRWLEIAGERGDIEPSFNWRGRLLRMQIGWAPESSWRDEPPPRYSLLHKLSILWERWRWPG